MNDTKTPISTTPHNDLFIQVLTRKDKAIAFFKRYLPKHILEIADLDQLELVESKHISNVGVSLYNDILYRCPVGKDQIAYFYTMCEQQSNLYAHMPLRLLKYDTVTIEDHLKQGYTKYPIMINMVVYTGKDPWNYSTAFSDYYADPELGNKHLYMAPFELVLLPEDKQDELYIDSELGFCFAALYCGRTKDAYQTLAEFIEMERFSRYFSTLPADDRVMVARYIGSCVERESYSLEKIVNLVVVNQQEKEKFMRSVAQQYIEQGIEQGMQQGMQQGRQEGRQEEFYDKTKYKDVYFLCFFYAKLLASPHWLGFFNNG
jgi:predicted transposase YdaD